MKIVVGFIFPEGDAGPRAAFTHDVVRFRDPVTATANEFETVHTLGDSKSVRVIFQYGRVVEPPSCFALSDRLRSDLGLMYLISLAEALPVGAIVRPRLPARPSQRHADMTAWLLDLVGPN